MWIKTKSLPIKKQILFVEFLKRCFTRWPPAQKNHSWVIQRVVVLHRFGCMLHIYIYIYIYIYTDLTSTFLAIILLCTKYKINFATTLPIVNSNTNSVLTVSIKLLLVYQNNFFHTFENIMHCNLFHRYLSCISEHKYLSWCLVACPLVFQKISFTIFLISKIFQKSIIHDACMYVPLLL